MPRNENGLRFDTNESEAIVETEQPPTAFILTEADLAALEYRVDLLHEAELRGFDKAWRYLWPLLEQAKHDADRFFRALGRATSLKPITKQGKNYAELCRERGEIELAERVERDMAELKFEVKR